ncbi:hypothetical protein [Schaalia cardiffensis]
MGRLKQYTAAVIAAALSLIFLIVGVLALTVFKPAQEFSSSVVPEHTLVMTRDGVLRLMAKNVTVTATSKSGAPVALGLGTPGDVLGWIGDDPYTEVVGLSSDRSLLKTEDRSAVGDAQSGAQSGRHAQSGTQVGTPGAQSQSSAQSGAQSAAQSGGRIDPEASKLLDALLASDMWLQVATNDGTAALSLTEVPASRSLLAVSAGGVGDLELTLTWPSERANWLAIISLLAALVFVLVAAIAAFSRFHHLNRAQRRSSKIATDAEATTESLEPAQEEMNVEDEGVQSEAPSDSQEHEELLEEQAQRRAAGEERDPLEVSSGPEELESSPSVETCEDEAPEEETRVVGRHGSGSPIDQDPPERESTDTGVIDLSSIRPGMTLPSRRALREARQKGEGTLIIDGREFDTGLIPVIEGKKNTEARDEHLSSGDAQSAGGDQDGDADDVAGRATKSEWTSFMPAWRKKSEEGKER